MRTLAQHEQRCWRSEGSRGTRRISTRARRRFGPDAILPATLARRGDRR